jgi:tRNA dimethylallyltransferase
LSILKTPSPDTRPPLIALIGPTAVGKTETAILLAERLNAEIVSADSRLFYRGMDIGTAKPTLAERARVPHHLIDVADPDQVWSLAVFQQAAEQAIAQIYARRRLPLLVGGTGQYVRAVIEGWTPPRVEPNPGLRAALQAWGEVLTPPRLHDRLRAIDPTAAEKIDPANLRRSIRALEVIFTTGERFSAQPQRQASPYRALVLGLIRPRPELYARIDARIEAMFAAGFVDEVRGLLAKGYTPSLPAFSAIGYQQVAAALGGQYALDEAVMLIKRLTRQFVRRQANWFKPNDPHIHWFEAHPGVAAEMGALVQTLNPPD